MRPWEAPGSASLDAGGYPKIPAGRSGAMSITVSGVMRWSFQAFPISDLIKNIDSQLGSRIGFNTWAPGRVMDKTELTGKYDFKLTYAEAGQIGDMFNPQTAGFSAAQESRLDVQDPGGGPDFVRALEKQLGLKLIKSKAAFDSLVVDHAERVPTEN
jgi:uncharacterized protein (TIGR03435 family)